MNRRDIIEMTGLSEDKVHKALDSLCSKRLLVRADYSGNYIAGPELSNDFYALKVANCTITDQGLHKMIISTCIRGRIENFIDQDPNNDETSEEELSVSDEIAPLLETIKANPDLVFSQGAAKLKMSELSIAPKKTLLYLCAHFLNNGSVPLDVLRLDIGKVKLKINAEMLLTGVEELASVGLVEKVFTDSDRDSENSKYTYRLSFKTIKHLFRGAIKSPNYGEFLQYGTVIKCADIKRKELFYDKNLQDKVNDLEKAFSVEPFKQITELLEDNGLRSSIACLFYGAPGAGKTELAKQLALRTGRDLMIADVSKLESQWMGASEKNYRAIFSTYKCITALMDDFPILLFNEADAIMQKRITNTRSYHDHLNNKLQNLLLEELENLEGIFIATTNHACNLDDGFKRRFVHKIHFDRPDVEALKKIWLEKIPTLSDEDLDRLVPVFRFTGAQIDNILSMMFIRQCVIGRKATIDEIISFCEEEAMGFSAKDIKDESKRVGF